MNIIESCENCNCIKASGGDFYCRRYPPKPYKILRRSDGIETEVIPHIAWVGKEDWCGEWRITKCNNL